MAVRQCVKCCTLHITVKFHCNDYVPMVEQTCGEYENQKNGEHLHCYCDVCGNDWCEEIRESRESILSKIADDE